MIKSRLHPFFDRLLGTLEGLAEYLTNLAAYLTDKLFNVFIMGFVVMGVMLVAPVAINPDARTAFISRFLAQTCQATNDCDLNRLLTGLAVALVILIGLVVFVFQEATDKNPILADDDANERIVALLRSLELNDKDYERLANFIAAEFVETKKPEAANEHTR